MNTLLFLVLALEAALALQDSPCPCIPRDECPRDYGKSATDVRELGFINPCQDYGTVRCCGVTVSIKLKDNSEMERAMEDIYTAESTVSYNYAPRDSKPRRRNPQGKLIGQVENEEEKAPETITWKLEDGGQNSSPGIPAKSGQSYERTRPKYLKPSLSKSSPTTKPFEKTSTVLKGISRRKEEPFSLATPEPSPVAVQIKNPEESLENLTDSSTQKVNSKSGQLRVPPLIPKIKPFNLKRPLSNQASLLKKPIDQSEEPMSPTAHSPQQPLLEEIPLKVTLRPFVRRRRPLAPKPSPLDSPNEPSLPPPEVKNNYDKGSSFSSQSVVTSIEQIVPHTLTEDPATQGTLRPFKGGKRLRKRIRPNGLFNNNNGMIGNPMKNNEENSQVSTSISSGSSEIGGANEPGNPEELTKVLIPIEPEKNKSEVSEELEESNGAPELQPHQEIPLINTQSESLEQPIRIKTPTEDHELPFIPTAPLEGETEQSKQPPSIIAYSQPPQRIRLSPLLNFSANFPPTSQLQEDSMGKEEEKFFRTRPILLHDENLLPGPKPTPVRVTSQYSRIRLENKEEEKAPTEERKPSRRFKIPAQLMRPIPSRPVEEIIPEEPTAQEENYDLVLDQKTRQSGPTRHRKFHSQVSANGDGEDGQYVSRPEDAYDTRYSPDSMRGSSENVEESQIQESYEEPKKPLRLRHKGPKYPTNPRPTNLALQEPLTRIEYTENEKVGQTGGFESQPQRRLTRLRSTTPSPIYEERSTTKFVFPPFRKTSPNPAIQNNESVKFEFKYSNNDPGLNTNRQDENKGAREETTEGFLRYQLSPTERAHEEVKEIQTTPTPPKRNIQAGHATLESLSVTVPKSQYTRFSVPNKFDFSVKSKEEDGMKTSFVLSSPFIPEGKERPIIPPPRSSRIKFPSENSSDFPSKIMTEVHQSENGTEIRITQKTRENPGTRGQIPTNLQLGANEEKPSGSHPVTHIRFSSLGQEETLITNQAAKEEQTIPLRPTVQTIPQAPQLIREEAPLDKIPAFDFTHGQTQLRGEEPKKIQEIEQHFAHPPVKINFSSFTNSQNLPNEDSKWTTFNEPSFFKVTEKPLFPLDAARVPSPAPVPFEAPKRPLNMYEGQKEIQMGQYQPYEELRNEQFARPAQQGHFTYSVNEEAPKTLQEPLKYQPPPPRAVTYGSGIGSELKSRPSRFPVSDMAKFLERPKEENLRQQVKPVKLGLSPDGPIAGGRGQYPQQFYQQVRTSGFQHGFQQHLQIQNQIMGRLRNAPRMSRAANLTSLDHNDLQQRPIELKNNRRNETKGLKDQLEKTLIAQIEQARKEGKSPEDFLALPHVIKGTMKQKKLGAFMPPKKIIRGFVPILPYSDKDPGPIFVKVNSLPMKV